MDKDEQIKDLTEKLKSTCDQMSKQFEAELNALKTSNEAETGKLHEQITSLKEQLAATKYQEKINMENKDMIIQQKDEELQRVNESMRRSSIAELEMRDSAI